MSPDAITLGRRQVYILPTRNGLMFTLVLTALLLAAVNYNNGLAYLLTFLLAGVAVVSILYANRNLLRLRVAAAACPPVFAGETAYFGITLTNDHADTRLGVVIECRKHEVARVDIPARASVTVMLPVPSRARGYLDCPPFTVCTYFPLGLFRAWSRRIALAHRCLVYPRPARAEVVPPQSGSASGDRPGPAPGGDDFAGLRPFRLGDPPQHVSWKAAARGQGLHTKQFSGSGQDSVWLEWQAFAPLDGEARLSRLTRAVLDAERAGLRYGLRLPAQEFAPDSGAVHRRRCLEALALFAG
ncbi:MAG: DUF58 domain-containing protein [Gammaproteobacteria bacterium]|nr:DUF58 domain-containing protein [Gammaproteobacteria bacterium]